MIVNEASSVSGSLYRAVWRWHFIAGLLVLPFLVMMAITGGAYLFKPELDHLIYRAWEDVPPRAGSDRAGKRNHPAGRDGNEWPGASTHSTCETGSGGPTPGAWTHRRSADGVCRSLRWPCHRLNCLRRRHADRA